MKQVNAELILNEAKKYEDEIIQFLRDLIAIPGEGCNEEGVVRRIEKEMKKIGFDEIIIDKMGNIIGRIDHGKTIILMDAHIDTVGTGDLEEWPFGPYEGKIENNIIYGRGASDQLAGMASMVYGMKLIKDLNLSGDYTIYVTGTCQEEPCEGLSLYNIIRDEKLITPDYVLITEPTNLRICRGQPGRLEMRITTKGKACHSSVPDQGINAIYKMQPIIEGIKELNNNLKVDDFLGKGTIAVTKIECDTPSSAAIPDKCTIDIDRRLTEGETKELAIEQLKRIIQATPDSKDAHVEILHYKATSWTGNTVSMEKYFPGWILPIDHPLTKVAVKTAEMVLNKKPEISKWAFSTNGIATMGDLKIPTIGFGPADDNFAHTVNDQVPIEHLTIASAYYALFPHVLVESTK